MLLTVRLYSRIWEEWGCWRCVGECGVRASYLHPAASCLWAVHVLGMPGRFVVGVAAIRGKR
jgi:hypothetical protein